MKLLEVDLVNNLYPEKISFDDNSKLSDEEIDEINRHLDSLIYESFEKLREEIKTFERELMLGFRKV